MWIKKDIEFDGKKINTLDHVHEMSLADFCGHVFQWWYRKSY